MYPDVILHLGRVSGTDHLKVKYVAVNMMSFATCSCAKGLVIVSILETYKGIRKSCWYINFKFMNSMSYIDKYVILVAILDFTRK